MTSDAADELHVHSTPDHEFAIAAAPNQTFTTINEPGKVAVELHHSIRPSPPSTSRPEGTTNVRRLGDLERAVMDQLWDNDGSQTVREVHNSLSSHANWPTRPSATVLQRLHCKNLVIQIRAGRAFRYAPSYGRDELVASLMVDVLDRQRPQRTTGRADALRPAGRGRRGHALRRALAEAG